MDRYPRTLQDLSVRCDVPVADLVDMIADSGRFYRQHTRPKLYGGSRIIHDPVERLRRVQTWVNRVILADVPVHHCALAFRPRLSTVHVGMIHSSFQSVLRLDLEGYYGSIKLQRIIAMFDNIGVQGKMSLYLARLCAFSADSLAEGAITSPAIANIVAYKLDRRINGVARQFDLRYSRYCDDILLSSVRMHAISDLHMALVISIIESEGFKVNPTKTVLSPSRANESFLGMTFVDYQ